MLCVVGLPLFYMELALGQFGSLGPITIWKLNPLLKGRYTSEVIQFFIYKCFRNIWNLLHCMYESYLVCGMWCELILLGLKNEPYASVSLLTTCETW